MTRPTPILKELAGAPSATVWGLYLNAADLPSHILRSEGFSGSGVAGLFELYDEMEEKDGHLFAVLQTRKNGVVSRPRKVVAASEAPRDQEIARFSRRANLQLEVLLTVVPERRQDVVVPGVIIRDHGHRAHLEEGVSVVFQLWLRCHGEVDVRVKTRIVREDTFGGRRGTTPEHEHERRDG